MLKQKLLHRTADAVELGNVRVEVRPASFRKLRGPTYIGIEADELAFFSLMIDIKTQMLKSSTPHAQA